jgi:hypothetical protein
MVLNIKLETGGFDFVGSRSAGEIIREKMKNALDSNETVTLDFGGIESVTQSFIDEFFGILIRANGMGYIRKRVLLVNENQSIKDTINFVIKYSKLRHTA